MAKNTIKVKNYSQVYEEMTAAGAITPGHFVVLGSGNTITVGALVGKVKMVAVENELYGKDITDAYASGDQVPVWLPQSGDIVYALLKAGETAVIGSALEVDSTGTLVVVDSSTTTDNIVGQAIEALDLSASGSSDSRIQVRIC